MRVLVMIVMNMAMVPAAKASDTDSALVLICAITGFCGQGATNASAFDDHGETLAPFS